MLFPLFGTGVIVRRTDVIDAPRIEQIERGRIKTRFFRKTTWALRSGYIFGILGLIYLLRVPLLIGVAESWIVRENIEKADAIMLLGGGIQTRTFEAARLYHQGYAPRVMVADVKLEPTDGLGVTVPQVELMKQVLLKNGVPPEAITIVGNQVSSTHEEALALRDWVRVSGGHKFIIPTELFHTRRVSWFFQKTLKGTGAEIRVQALDPLKYTSSNWWQREEGLEDFQKEVIKSVYYFFRY